MTCVMMEFHACSSEYMSDARSLFFCFGFIRRIQLLSYGAGNVFMNSGTAGNASPFWLASSVFCPNVLRVSKLGLARESAQKTVLSTVVLFTHRYLIDQSGLRYQDKKVIV